MTRLLIDERSLPDGLARVELEIADDLAILYVHNAPIGQMPIDALLRVMKRYGKPLEDGVIIPEGGLQLNKTDRLVMMRFLARYDVIGRDWLVLVSADAPIGDLAVSITGALEHLASAYGRNTAT